MSKEGRRQIGAKSKAEADAESLQLARGQAFSARPPAARPALYSSSPEDFLPGHDSREELQQELQLMLDKQLSSDLNRAKLVEFLADSSEAHGPLGSKAGLASLSEFRQLHEVPDTHEDGVEGAHSGRSEARGTKRLRNYGSAPGVQTSLHQVESHAPCTQLSGEPFGGAKTLGALRPASMGDERVGSTPLDRARGEEKDTRSAAEVFAEAAPSVLSLMEARAEELEEPKGEVIEGSPERQELVSAVSETEILANRLSVEELKSFEGGRFAAYEAGVPSQTLYLKNLSATVEQNNLKALFLRFQHPALPPLKYRLMQRGRMKGQAFITFPDQAMACAALNLVNGYKLKGRPVVIQYAKGSQSVAAKDKAPETSD